MPLDRKVELALSKLLSSQRELLNNMSSHGKLSAAVGGQRWYNQEIIDPPELGAPGASNFQEVYANRNRRSSLDLLLSRRLSIGMGFDGYIMDTMPSHNNEGVPFTAPDMATTATALTSNELLYGSDVLTVRSKKRRLSRMGDSEVSGLLHNPQLTPRSEALADPKLDASIDHRGFSEEPKPVVDPAESTNVFAMKGDSSQMAPDMSCPIWHWADAKAVKSFHMAMQSSQSSQQTLRSLDGEGNVVKQFFFSSAKSSITRKRLFETLPQFCA